MSDIYELTTAPFVPKEEVFSEKPIRTSAEKKMGMGAFLKDGGGDDNKEFVFDEDHFKKFLKEDNNNTQESENNNNNINGQRPNGIAYKRKRQNILGDFRFKRIDELF